QIVPGLVFTPQEQKEFAGLRKQYEDIKKERKDEASDMKKRIIELSQKQQVVAANVQMIQELGGLVGRFALAWLALRIVSRRSLLRVFQLPGLILIPLVFLIPGAGNLADRDLNLLMLKV